METPVPTPLRMIKFGIPAVMFVIGALVYPKLPAMIPTHWNFAGQADSWMPKAMGTWLIPALTLVLAILFPVLRRLDPKAENYAVFQRTWEVIQLSIIGMMAYIFCIQIYASLHPEASALVGQLVTFGVGALFVVIGNVMGKIRQNYFVGLRTPWSLSDPDVWQKSQRFAGWAFVLGGLALIGEVLFWKFVPVVFLAIIASIVILPIVYSYLIYRKKKTLLPLIILCVVILAGLTIGMRLLSGEDGWICSDNQWVPHGHPAAPLPQIPCE